MKYCKNYNCKWIRFLSEPIHFKFNDFTYVAFDDDLCLGECRKEETTFNSMDLTFGGILYNISVCADLEEKDK